MKTIIFILISFCASAQVANNTWSVYVIPRTALNALLGSTQTDTTYQYTHGFTTPVGEGMLAHPNGYVYGTPTFDGNNSFEQ